jgi:DNA mismatch repair protein MutS
VTIDKVTLKDLSFFKNEKGVFSLLHRTTTQAGANIIKQWIQKPSTNLEQLQEQQLAVRFWMAHHNAWAGVITNGTLVMIEKYYETSDGLTGKPSAFNLWLQSYVHKLFNRNEYSFVRFSVAHVVDFLKGINALVPLLQQNPPKIIREILEKFQQQLQIPLCNALINIPAEAPQSELLSLSYSARRELKHIILQLIQWYAQLDAQHALAIATLEHGWAMPNLLPSSALTLSAQGLYHPLLKQPVSYDIHFSKEQHFLFLTGANMSGKTTLIRSLGVASLLAHIGCGVPAQQMTISFLKGIITNMQVEDNIFLGESYFFAEVQRMKLTAQKLSVSQYHLVLMDELFKGTNVHDAYECSHAVIHGLLQQKDNIMALSTHLNELSKDLEKEKSVFLRYCYTEIKNDNTYHFTYQLHHGVSKDRIGYLVLKNEGVLDYLYQPTHK